MTPKQLLERLEQTIGLNGSTRRLREASEAELITHFGYPAIQAAELAEKFEEPLRDLINRTAVEKEATGSMPVIVCSGTVARNVLGSCTIEVTDTPDVIATKTRRLHVEPLLEAIRALTFQEFEIFGAKILQELGASRVKVTPHSEDQGIDFYGVLSIGEIAGAPAPLVKLAHDIKLRFAGQAKHYPTRALGPSAVRELVGAVSFARHKIFTRDPDLFEELELLAFNPLLAMIFTTGRFTRGASELASAAGIIARSGEQLSLFLADQGVGMKADGAETVFDADLFRDWLQSKKGV